MKRPVMLMAGSYILGIITVRSGGVLLFPLCLLVISLVFLIKTRKYFKNLVVTAVILFTCILFFDLGIFLAYKVQLPSEFEKVTEEDKDYTFTAVVEAVNGEKGNYRIELSHSKEKIMLFSDTLYNPGDEVILTGIIKKYPSKMNDGEFDTKAFYKCRNIVAYVYANSRM